MTEIPANSLESAADEELMTLTAKGRQEAFTHLVHRHQQPLVNFFRRMGVYNSAEDLAQETFVKLFKSRERYRPQAKFTTFLYLVARRTYIDYVRRQAREQKKREAAAEQLVTEQAFGTAGESRRAEAEEALLKLSEDMRSVVVMNIYQGLKYQEIAEAMDIPVNTVKTRMFYAMRKLREIMTDDNASNP